jgi:hypothetical protein
LILDFTDNPYFKEAAVLETQQANKVRLDLENIIVISEKVRDLSERLNHGGTSFSLSHRISDLPLCRAQL